MATKEDSNLPCATCGHGSHDHAFVSGPKRCYVTGCVCEKYEAPAHHRRIEELFNGGMTNLDQGMAISMEINALKTTQKALKDAFAHRELDGGPKAALEHPLYLQAQARIEELEEELTLLI